MSPPPEPGSGPSPIGLPPLPDATAAPPPPPPADPVAAGSTTPSGPVELPDIEPILRAAAAGVPPAAPVRPPPAAAPLPPTPPTAPPAEGPVRHGRFAFASASVPEPAAGGSAAHDAEVMARIMAGKQERDAEAQESAARVAVATEHERRETARVRQRIAIEMYLQAQARQIAEETPLQRALRETADSFMALGICPDHLEYLPDIGKFCSWGGLVHDHASIHAIRDKRGYPLYTLGASPHGEATVCWSRRECGWKLDRALDPAAKLTAIDRLVPIPMRRDNGTYRFSARRAATIIMEEGLTTIYVIGNGVYTLSHLQAAHHRFAVEKRAKK